MLNLGLFAVVDAVCAAQDQTAQNIFTNLESTLSNNLLDILTKTHLKLQYEYLVLRYSILFIRY